MQLFKSSLQAQRFLSAHAFIYGHFRPRLWTLPPTTSSKVAKRYRASRAMPSNVWQQETCAEVTE
jgi:putative transposase